MTKLITKTTHHSNMLFKEILEEFIKGIDLCIVTANVAEQKAFQTIMLFDEHLFNARLLDTASEEQLQFLFNELVKLNNNVKV